VREGNIFDAFSEDLIEFFGDAQLMLLQLRQVANHQGILVVGHDHGLENGHVARGELAEAVVHHAAQVTFALHVAIDHVLDVVLALLQVVDDFLEVLKHEVFVREQLLTLKERADLLLLNLFALLWLQNSHRVKVVLPEEEHVQTRLLEVRQAEREGALAKHINLLSRRHQAQHLNYNNSQSFQLSE